MTTGKERIIKKIPEHDDSAGVKTIRKNDERESSRSLEVSKVARESLSKISIIQEAEEILANPVVLNLLNPLQEDRESTYRRALTAGSVIVKKLRKDWKIEADHAAELLNALVFWLFHAFPAGQ